MTLFRRSLFVASLGILSACSDPSAPPATGSLQIFPRPSSLILGGSVQLNSDFRDSHGDHFDSTFVVWQSSAPGVLSVSATGLVRSVTPGSATITATAAGAQDQVTVGVTSSFSQLSTAGLVTCGVTGTGAAYCRGTDNYSQLGGEYPPDSNTFVAVYPGAVPQSALPFRGVFPDGSTTCALGADSSAWCWGYGFNGELGIGQSGGLSSPSYSLGSPTSPVTGGHHFARLAKGSGHTCGLTAAHVAYCWGENFFGETGDQLTATRDPAPVLGRQFIALGAGGETTCGLSPAGAAYCWGDNSSGQLGVLTDTLFPSPVPVAGGPFQSLSVRLTTCALDPDGTPYCWGSNTAYPRPQPVSGGLAFTQVTSASTHGCGLAADSAAYCWSAFALTPELVPSPVKFSGVAAGDDWDCGVGVDSAAYCWPDSCPQSYVPYCGQQQTVSQVPGRLKFRSVSANAFDGVGCGQSIADTLYCWGMNWPPLFGLPAFPIILSPQPIAGSAGLRAITLGYPICGLAADSTALCWTITYTAGADSVVVSGSQAVPGALHYASFDRQGNRSCGTVGGQVYCGDSSNTAPTPVAGATGFTSVGTDGATICGLKSDGSAYCWGRNGHGELGVGYASSWSPHSQPVGGGHAFVDVAVGEDHACGVASDSTTWCWGGNYLPDSLRTPPRLVPGGLKLGSLALGFDFTCGLTGPGAAYCWGRGLATPTPYQPAQRFQSLSASEYLPGITSTDVCGLTLSGDPVCWALPTTVPAPRRARAQLQARRQERR